MVSIRAPIAVILLTLAAAAVSAQTIPPVEATETPLHWAARYGLVEIARGLVANGAVVDAPDQFGRTPLHRAVAYPRMVEYLIEAGAELDALDVFGRTPLHQALQYPQTVEMLIRAGADISVRDALGRTPLERTLRYGPRSRNLRVIELLIGAGAGGAAPRR